MYHGGASILFIEPKNIIDIYRTSDILLILIFLLDTEHHYCNHVI
jgi:hypothetical protein